MSLAAKNSAPTRPIANRPQDAILPHIWNQQLEPWVSRECERARKSARATMHPPYRRIELTDTMYNSQDWPYVLIEHIEKYWAPTVLWPGLVRAGHSK